MTSREVIGGLSTIGGICVVLSIIGFIKSPSKDVPEPPAVQVKAKQENETKVVEVVRRLAARNNTHLPEVLPQTATFTAKISPPTPSIPPQPNGLGRRIIEWWNK